MIIPDLLATRNRIRPWLLAGAAILAVTTARAAGVTGREAKSEFKPLEPGWTSGMDRFFESEPREVKRWTAIADPAFDDPSKKLFNADNPQDRVLIYFLSRIYSVDQMQESAGLTRLLEADSPRYIAQVLFGLQAKHAAERARDADELQQRRIERDFTALKAAFGPSFDKVTDGAARKVETALRETRERRTTSIAADSQAIVIGLAVHATGEAKTPLLQLHYSKSPLGFVQSAIALARSAATRTAPRPGPHGIAGLIANRKTFVSYQGQLQSLTDLFARYLATSRRNSKGFIDSRQWEFRDHLAAVLFYAEALRWSRLSRKSTLRTEGEKQVEAMFVSAAASWLRSTRGILSFSNLPFDRVVAIVYPAFEPMIRANPRVAELLRDAFHAAMAVPAGDAYMDPKPLKRELLTQAAIFGGLLALINVLLPGFSFYSWKLAIAISAIALFSLILEFGGGGAPPLKYQLRDWWAYRRGLARFNLLAKILER